MKLSYIAPLFAAAIMLGSCSLDAEIFDEKDGATAYTSLKDITNALNGTYSRVGGAGFLGNYAVSLGDVCSGISTGSASTGHLYSYNTYTFSETDPELEALWQFGYKVVMSATDAINGARKLQNEGVILPSEEEDYHSTLAQLYGLKTLANYYLTGYFALPYSESTKSTPGIILVGETAPAPFAPVSRASVGEVYEAMKADIATAEQEYQAAGDVMKHAPYYLSQAALQALKARVYLATADYATAKAAALRALDLQGNGSGRGDDNVPSADDYLGFWGNLAANAEDIFTIKKADDDNLSANSLYTLYYSYSAGIQDWVVNLFDKADIRANLFVPRLLDAGLSTRKHTGMTQASAANIPVFRKSEMSLIVAECEAREGNLDAARDYLFYTAKRNLALTSPDDLPADRDGILDFIVAERVREFNGEGHYFFDARRMGLKVSASNFSDWDISRFCLPIPAAEINAGFGCQQTKDWSDYLPRH